MHDDSAIDPPSKSQRKREAHALQALGERLVELSQAQLQKLPLPAPLSEAVRFAQGLRQRGARKRQLQYIGRLMRSIDAAPIQRALADLEAQGVDAKRQHRYLERMCTAFMEDDQVAQTAFFDSYPAADRQLIRQLVRGAQREQQQDRPAKSRRRLYRYLREALESADDAVWVQGESR